MSFHLFTRITVVPEKEHTASITDDSKELIKARKNTNNVLIGVLSTTLTLLLKYLVLQGYYFAKQEPDEI